MITRSTRRGDARKPDVEIVTRPRPMDNATVTIDVIAGVYAGGASLPRGEVALRHRTHRTKEFRAGPSALSAQVRVASWWSDHPRTRSGAVPDLSGHGP
jgi:hypothetical protein